MSKVARPYQAQAIETLWSGMRERPVQLCTLPTGTGKSFIITELMNRLAAVNYRSLLLLNREILVKQFAKDISNAGIFAAGLNSKEFHSTITAAMIQSCHKHVFEDVRVILVDEAHNLAEEGMYADFIRAHPGARVIGFTATPFNSDGYIYGAGMYFPRRDYYRSLEAMISDGYLVRPRSLIPPAHFDTTNIRHRKDDYVLEELNGLVSDRKKAREQVIDALSRLTDRRKVLWMCLNVEHAEMIRSEIESFEACSIIHSKMLKGTQEAHRQLFERGPNRHMVSVMMITEGYDFPAADGLVLLRPTRSAKLYVQSVGRVLRPAEGKADAIVLDYGEIIKNLGSIYNPHIEQKHKKKASEENTQSVFYASGIKLCPNCFEVIDIRARNCACGYEQSREVDANLQRKAAELEIERIGREVKVTDVSFEQHKSHAGNECVRVNFHSGIIMHSQFFTAHPFSWGQGRRMIRQLTGWDFDTFAECYANVEQITIEKLPVAVMVKKDGRWEKITKVIYQ